MFAARVGHARVPQNHREDGLSIGSWVGVQRDKRDKLTLSSAPAWRLLPGWSWKPHEDRWQRAYELVVCPK